MRINSIDIMEGVSNIYFQGASSLKTSVVRHDDLVPYDGGFHMFMGDVVEAVRNTNTVMINGGEPMDQYEDLLELCRLLKKANHYVLVITRNKVDPTKDCYIKLNKVTDKICSVWEESDEKE